ncbi:hypothetical protein [Streptomyces sp. NPDC005408]|uniref:hypothetical protein n=1 Tax=Streptomyces sp. NPDC005408 TaxID=3155341 RepID=UPI0033BA47EE
MGRSAVKLSRLLAVVTPLFLISACAGGEELATVQASSVVGTWSEPSGGLISLREDHTFEVSGLEVKSQIYDDCPDGSGGGSWGFFVDEGKVGGSVFVSKKATSGNSLGLTFEGVPQGGCEVSLNVVDGGKALCASDDPDLPCGLDIRLTRAESAKEPSEP